MDAEVLGNLSKVSRCGNPYTFSTQLLRSRCNAALNGSIKPSGGEKGRDGEASTLLAKGEVLDLPAQIKIC